ncbi:hypothetical protein PLICRDRAFT_41281 [Plicaturopsis crispa FD-325 SS-3]|nr:hypothetical protein PLICRDRAFT_41281 [Plicaturopsis crispa FD-325 SS-3]
MTTTIIQSHRIHTMHAHAQPRSRHIYDRFTKRWQPFSAVGCAHSSCRASRSGRCEPVVWPLGVRDEDEITICDRSSDNGSIGRGTTPTPENYIHPNSISEDMELLLEEAFGEPAYVTGPRAHNGRGGSAPQCCHCGWRGGHARGCPFAS